MGGCLKVGLSDQLNCLLLNLSIRWSKILEIKTNLKRSLNLKDRRKYYKQKYEKRSHIKALRKKW